MPYVHTKPNYKLGTIPNEYNRHSAIWINIFYVLHTNNVYSPETAWTTNQILDALCELDDNWSDEKEAKKLTIAASVNQVKKKHYNPFIIIKGKKRDTGERIVNYWYLKERKKED